MKINIITITQINYKMSPLWLLTDCEKFLKWEAETDSDASSYGNMKARKVSWLSSAMKV